MLRMLEGVNLHGQGVVQSLGSKIIQPIEGWGLADSG